MTKLRVHSFTLFVDGYDAGAGPDQGLGARELGYECTEHVSTPAATHAVLTKRK